MLPYRCRANPWWTLVGTESPRADQAATEGTMKQGSESPPTDLHTIRRGRVSSAADHLSQHVPDGDKQNDGNEHADRETMNVGARRRGRNVPERIMSGAAAPPRVLFIARIRLAERAARGRSRRPEAARSTRRR